MISTLIELFCFNRELVHTSNPFISFGLLLLNGEEPWVRSGSRILFCGFSRNTSAYCPFPISLFSLQPSSVSTVSEMEFQIYFEIALKYGEVRGFPQACVSLGCRNFVLFKLECLGIIASNGRSVLV